ncbi:MAG: FmdB family zinc ribbon protein [Gemmatimonadales bacterium]
MPKYAYRCAACGEAFDRAEPIGEHGRVPPTCPSCKSRKVAQVLTPFFAKTARKS